jgi:hypothetical protein
VRQVELAEIIRQCLQGQINAVFKIKPAFDYCELFERVEVGHREGLANVEEIQCQRRYLLDIWFKHVS